MKISVTGDGLKHDREVPVLLAPLRTVVRDDMESNRGWEVSGTARTGTWERAMPQQTIYQNQVFQPGSQHTPGGKACWVTGASAGASVGANDVDGGYTDLFSPVIDLAHLSFARLELYRWYAESVGNDPFEIAVSTNGGTSWTTVLTSATSTKAWSQYLYELSLPLTSQMRFRFRAQDLNASLVEALVDDFSIRGVAADGSITLLTSGARGSVIQLGLNGTSGGLSTLLVSLKTSGGISIPGIAGTLLLDLPSTVILVGYGFDASGFRAVDLTIPNAPALFGKKVYFQMFYERAGQRNFGNRQTLTIK